MAAVVASVSAAVVGLAGFKLGLFDRPAFKFYQRLLAGKERELIAIVAITTEKNIPSNVGRLMTGVLKALESSPKGAVMMKAAAKLYDEKSEANKLGIGLYLDNPSAKPNPRWASGFGVEDESMTLEDYQKLASSIQAASGLSEQLKAVRIGKDNILKATIPWRHYWTPKIAPFLHWGRAFGVYAKGGADGTKYTADNGRNNADEGPIALEVYLCDNEAKMRYIDYVVLFGDTKNTWDDSFPAE